MAAVRKSLSDLLSLPPVRVWLYVRCALLVRGAARCRSPGGCLA